MSQQPDLTTTDLSRASPSRADGWRLIQTAPGPETPDTPDRGARQKGMAIIIGAGATFWGGVSLVAWYLLNR
ncbi:hypothetical protein [Phenylobacterium sp.]|jgi:hypothetical protein|uniref:hypothetical protein n=1 Tax=Phenylobacterium sp. TaxID=1871053 RepID=UPI002F93D84B